MRKYLDKFYAMDAFLCKVLLESIRLRTLVNETTAN